MKIEINKEYILIVPKGTKIEIFECMTDSIKDECFLMENPTRKIFEDKVGCFGSYFGIPISEIASVNMNKDNDLY